MIRDPINSYIPTCYWPLLACLELYINSIYIYTYIYIYIYIYTINIQFRLDVIIFYSVKETTSTFFNYLVLSYMVIIFPQLIRWSHSGDYALKLYHRKQLKPCTVRWCYLVIVVTLTASLCSAAVHLSECPDLY